MNKRVLVFGLGDIAHTDDGFGVHVINHLRKKNCIKNIEILDASSLKSCVIKNFSDIEQLIVVETAEFNSDPGSVKVFEGIEMDAFVGKEKMTCVHKSGIDNILNLTRTHGRLPNHRALVCMQSSDLKLGTALSEKGETAIPKACKKVFEITANWVV